MKLPVYSYTFLNTYGICPKQAFHRYVLKDIPFKETSQMKWGTRVHEGMEQRIGKGEPLAPELARYEFYAQAIETLKPNVEMKLGIKRDGSPCAFFADDVWLRGKADVAAKVATTAILFDWKTGKRREDPYELDLQGLMLKAVWPGVTKITGHYIWLADNKIGKPHDVSNTGKTLELVQDKADEIEQRFKSSDWPAKPSGLCGWCAVKTCQHNPGRT